ncbi:protein S100-P [Larimichthys crocea]|uniref:protein S100-P n=1 Tax=Larimichthys crocea TaxID=215358 RepID=UPI000901DD9D|nr:protein S100-P [Larimichthys crocea]
MSQLETAMSTLIQTFYKYATVQGKPDTLTQAEFKTLLEKELPGLIKPENNPEKVEELMEGLDCNGDKEIDFTEFMTFVTVVIYSFNEVLRSLKLNPLSDCSL